MNSNGSNGDNYAARKHATMISYLRDNPSLLGLDGMVWFTSLEGYLKMGRGRGGEPDVVYISRYPHKNGRVYEARISILEYKCTDCDGQRRRAERMLRGYRGSFRHNLPTFLIDLFYSYGGEVEERKKSMIVAADPMVIPIN